MKNVFLGLMVCSALFAANMLGVSAIDDDGIGGVSITFSYDFTDEVAGFEFDLLSDMVLTVDALSIVEGENISDWMISANETGKMIGFDLSGSVVTSTGTLFTISGTYDVADAGTTVALNAVEDCDTNGTSACTDDGDTRMVLASAAGTALEESSFAAREWIVGTGMGDVLGIDDFGIYTFGLSKNYPNPFNPTTTIGYDVATPGEVSIVIYDMMGRQIKTLVSDYYNPGSYSAIWDARNNQGVVVSAGMYIYKMIAGDFVKVNKMLLVK